MKREKGPDGRGQRGKNDILLLTGKFRGPFVVGASAFNPKQVPAGPQTHQRATSPGLFQPLATFHSSNAAGLEKVFSRDPRRGL